MVDRLVVDHGIFNIVISTKDEYLLPNIDGKIVLELGSFDGKWVNYMGEAKRVICADLDRKGFDVLKERLKWDTLEFYECAGRDFKGIPDGSVDFVFCMDSLVRSEREILNSYIAEIKRILTPDGKMCVHMPAQDQHMSWELGFTQIGSQEILQLYLLVIPEDHASCINGLFRIRVTPAVTVQFPLPLLASDAGPLGLLLVHRIHFLIRRMELSTNLFGCVNSHSGPNTSLTISYQLA